MYNFVNDQKELILSNKRSRFITSSTSVLNYEINFDLTHPFLPLFWDDENIFVVDIILLNSENGLSDTLYIYNNGVYLRSFFNHRTNRMETRSNVELDIRNGKVCILNDTKNTV